MTNSAADTAYARRVCRFEPSLTFIMCVSLLSIPLFDSASVAYTPECRLATLHMTLRIVSP